MTFLNIQLRGSVGKQPHSSSQFGQVLNSMPSPNAHTNSSVHTASWVHEIFQTDTISFLLQLRARASVSNIARYRFVWIKSLVPFFFCIFLVIFFIQLMKNSLTSQGRAETIMEADCDKVPDWLKVGYCNYLGVYQWKHAFGFFLLPLGY